MKARSSCRLSTDRCFDIPIKEATSLHPYLRRLIKVQKSADSGIHNGVVVYLYDGHKVLETRNGSNQLVQQFMHGTQYVDEVVMTRVVRGFDVVRRSRNSR